MKSRILIVEDDLMEKEVLESVIVKRMTVNGLRSAHCCIEDIEAETIANDIFARLSAYVYRIIYGEDVSFRVFIDGVLAGLGNVLDYLLDQQGKLSKSGFFEQLKCKDKIKALYKPLHIIPQSLHPCESLAR